MKLTAPDAADTTTCSLTNWFPGICLSAFLAIYAPSAVAKTGAGGLNPAEKWVVAQVTAGDIADLSKKFPEKKDRKLSAKFVQDLLTGTGTLLGVKLHRNGVRIIGAIIEEPIDMSNAQIPWEVWLNDCQFSSAAIFVRANFAGTVSFEDSTFKADANFYGMKVGQLAVFNNAIFERWVDFGSADIAGHFKAEEATFKDKVKGASFNSIKVRDCAFFQKAVFEGWVSFILADITRNFQADEARFTSNEQGVEFYGMKVGRFASFNKAIFEGWVDFNLAEIAADFHAAEAEFRSEIYTVLLAINCRGNGDFTGAKFARWVSFAESTFLDLVVGGYKDPGAAPVALLDLSHSSVKRQLRLQKIRIHDLVARSLRAEGSADFTDVIVEHSADLSNADFATLDLSGSAWPKDGNDGEVFRMQGMNYKYLQADSDESKSHEALLKLADQSAYTNDVYSNLEEFFLRQGYHGDADEAFIAKKRREREEYFRSGQWSRWLGSWMLNLLVGYGRRPWQAGIPCAVFVALGCVLFSPKKMELQKPEDTPRVYSRFWYSLGLFLPFVDLQADKVWKPKADQTFLRNYMRVHIMLGWILIPIVLAALTGLIK